MGAVDPMYEKRLKMCIACPNGDNRRAVCRKDGEQYHRHASSGECPLHCYGMGLPAKIELGYRPTAANATKGGCGCKKLASDQGAT
jgi:hypothetical protein